ncbi:hypothetical protein ACLB2K_045583 [Fragaria x ananassa]
MASSSSRSSGLNLLEELQWGVVKTFNPTDAQLVGHYLYNQTTLGHGGNGMQAFPDLDIYGESGMEPWAVWDSLEPIRIPHQDFSYFFARVKKLSSKGKRLCRRVGSGGTWSETEPGKDVFVDAVQQAYGKLRKLRYENKDEESFGYQHHGAWLMEEYTINHLPDLALYRLKVNGKGGHHNQRNKRKTISDETPSSSKKQKLELKRDQQPPQCDDHDYSVDQNLVLSPTGFGLDDDDDQFTANLDQWNEELLHQIITTVPQQQVVEPNSSNCEQLQQQGEQQLLPSPSPSLGGDDSQDTLYIQSDEFNAFEQDLYQYSILLQ